MGGRYGKGAPLDFSVGIIRVKPSDRHPDLLKLLTDFPFYLDEKELERGEGHFYFLGLTPGKYKAYWNTNAKTCAVFYVDGETVDIRTPLVRDDMMESVGIAKGVRENFIGYLKEKEIPHKVLLTLFDD